MSTVDFSQQLRQRLAEHREGGPLERWFYTDETLYRLEMESIFHTGWLFVGYSCQLRRPGDYFTYEFDGESVILVRADDGQVHALYNTCRHRGSRICTQAEGHVGKLVCPYHQWVYGRDGRLNSCGSAPDPIDKSAYPLARAHVGEVGGLLFLSLADEPPEFKPAYDTLAPQLAPHGLERAKVACALDYEIEANWKLVWENNRECLHCPVGHPQYVRANYDVAAPDDAELQAEIEQRSRDCTARCEAMGLPVRSRQAGLVYFPDGLWHRASRTPLAEGFVTESVDGRPVAPLMGQFQEYDMGTLRLSTLPNFWNHSSSDHSVSTRLTPAGPQRTRALVTWLVHEDAVEGRDYQLDKLLPFWRLTSEQDWELCKQNQLGVNSRRYRPGPYSQKQEYNVERFVQWYLDEMRRAAQ